MKSTLYRPKTRKRKKKHGFLKRSRSKAGRKVILQRIRKGRYKLTV